MTDRIAFSRYELSSKEQVLRRDGMLVKLPPKAIGVLEGLLRKRNEVVLKDELIQAAWHDEAVDDASLTQMVFLLRRLFKDDPSLRIETIPRRGYRLVIDEVAPPAPAFQRGNRGMAPVVVAALVALLVLTISSSSRPAQHADPLAVQRAYATWFTARTDRDVERSLTEYRDLLHVAPDDARANAGISYAYLSMAMRDRDPVRGSVDVRAAFTYAQRAVELDDGLAEAHAALARAEAVYGKKDQAAEEFERALALEPAAAVTRTWYGELLLSQGRVDDAAVQLQRAQSVNTPWTEAGDDLALIMYLRHRYALAVALTSQSLTLNDGDTFARFIRALAEAPGDAAAAMRDARRLTAAYPARAVGAYALLGSLERARGHAAEGDRAFTRAQALAARIGAVDDPLVVVGFAGAFAQEHRPQDAFAWLTRMSTVERQIFASDPRLDPLRDSSEFQHWVHAS